MAIHFVREYNRKEREAAVAEKILIVTRSMYGGGAERVIAQLANFFVRDGEACDIVTLDKDVVSYRLDERVGLTAIGKKASNNISDKLKRYGRLREIAKERRVDCVLALPEDIGSYTILALAGTGIPVIVSERNDPRVMPVRKSTRLLRKLMYPLAKGLIFQTESARSFFPARIRAKGIVLPNPVDASRIPPRFEGERDKVIVGAGRLESQKNFGLLVSAFALFSQRHPEYKLVIYGEGELKDSLEKQACDLGIRNKVLLPGREEKLLERMRTASMFVLSSDYEGSPNVLIEAICLGMPVISTDCPSYGPRELVRDGVNGLLVPVGDAEAMAEAMERLSDPGYAGQLGNNAHKLREQLISADVFERWKGFLCAVGKGNP